MFPTFSSLVNHLFGTDFSWPIPTFGFFVTLAFVLSYLIFRSEFGRKERLGEMTSFRERLKWGTGAKFVLLAGYGLLGFLVGDKGVGALLDPERFSRDPLGFLFSGAGSPKAGWLLAVVFCSVAFAAYSKPLFSKNRTETRWTRPRELLPLMLLCAGTTGFIGAKAFSVFEDGRLWQAHTVSEILHFGGLTFWGGLLFGGAGYFFIGMRRGLHWKHLADAGSLGMLAAYGIGRIGCHLSGDGDWGVVNRSEKPVGWLPDWTWSFRFPHNAIGLGEPIPGCEGRYCQVLPEGVFPTSFYESAVILSVFAILWMLRSRIKPPGRMFAIYLLAAGTERFLIEFIRVNYKFDLFGIPLSEAQVVGLLMTSAAVPLFFSGKRKVGAL